jgi:branched-chain amino acid transport system ATP-binding protein
MSTKAAAGDVLQLDDIHLYYGAIHALKGVSLRVGAGEIVTLIGANGAGKSTTLRAINGLNRPRQGSIRFEGRDITMAPPHEIVGGGIAQSPEGRRLFPRMTVIENLEMGAFQRSDKENFQGDMDRVFELFPRLYERRTQKAGTMSGGEQQMCAIGRALMARPKLLLLDEPSMGLAPIFVEKIFEIVVEINTQGTPVLLVEQNALMALDTAHRGYVMETGRITLEGPAAELKTNEAVQKAYLGLEDASSRGQIPEGGRLRRHPSPPQRPGQLATSAVLYEAPLTTSAGYGGPRMTPVRPSEPARPSAIASAVAVLCDGTRPSARAAPASRQPATMTRLARSSIAPQVSQSANGSRGCGAPPLR